MEMNKFYITTPIYYANAAPHIGHAYTTIAADILANFYREQKKDVFFLTGMDEHGMKIQKKAEEEGKKSQEFVDEISGEFKSLWKKLGIRHDYFIRTTDPKHKKAVQKVLQSFYDKSAIYKGKYKGLYCAGCEQFKNENDLIDGKCPDHNIKPEKIKEECYLLKMSEKQDELIGKIKSGEFEIAPERYKKEILSFLEGQKLQDISISRKNVAWGIPLPFDNKQTAYVWIDAFLNYLTGIGWNGDINKIPTQWPADVQIIGKDILRVHATIWPIMLLHLGLPLPKKLFVHGHILSGGKKMSKTLGNVISVEEMLGKFGVDGTRYLLLSAGTFGEDVDMTIERMTEKYNADLANGLGNLISRVVKLSLNSKSKIPNSKQIQNSKSKIINYLEDLEIRKAPDYIWNIVHDANKFIEDNRPWELAKDESKKEDFEKVIQKLVNDLSLIAELLEPFLPETSEKIKKALNDKELKKVLFERIKN